MAPYISPDKAGLLSTLLEAVLYGFSVLMFIAALWIFLHRRGSMPINYPMIIIACLLFVLSTIHLGVDFNRLVVAFVTLRDSYPGGPSAWFANPSQRSFIFKNAIYTFQTVLGDGVVIYRCYMVWRSFWVILVPSILWVAVAGKLVYLGFSILDLKLLAVAGAGSVYSCTLPTTLSNDIYARELGQWIKSFYFMTFSCNLIATALLAYRLWTIDRSVNNTRLGKGIVIPVLMVVIDAGALYSFTVIAAVTCFVVESNGQYVVLDMVTPIISIAFYMVILRIGIAQRYLHGSTILTTTIPRLPLSQRDAGLKAMHVSIDVQQAVSYSDQSGTKAEQAEKHRAGISRV
ncbi:hypothetical protein MVEN_00462300 [Mycena venus]|uniref:Uncharacterized protein n=1 Tax=Mycena venus TaxID=2733690 RepID=A0A8H7DAS0_9AGAR|nr:hypothetical protein MVEN_00462300 [Mycena venus]